MILPMQYRKRISQSRPAPIRRGAAAIYPYKNEFFRKIITTIIAII